MNGEIRFSYIPEYDKFYTEEIVNKVYRYNDQNITIASQKKEGGLGDMVDLYIKLTIEESLKKSFWGRLRGFFSPSETIRNIQRKEVLRILREALSIVKMEW